MTTEDQVICGQWCLKDKQSRLNQACGIPPNWSHPGETSLFSGKREQSQASTTSNGTNQTEISLLFNLGQTL